jgi:hypothetical protein
MLSPQATPSTFTILGKSATNITISRVRRSQPLVAVGKLSISELKGKTPASDKINFDSSVLILE